MCTAKSPNREKSSVSNDDDASRQLESLDDFDDLYQAGLSADQLAGKMAAFADCFNYMQDCSELERHIIDNLKAYLRPQKAPASLVERCKHCLDEDNAEGGTVSGQSDDSSNNTDNANRSDVKASASALSSARDDTHNGEIVID